MLRFPWFSPKAKLLAAFITSCIILVFYMYPIGMRRIPKHVYLSGNSGKPQQVISTGKSNILPVVITHIDGRTLSTPLTDAYPLRAGAWQLELFIYTVHGNP